MLLHGFGTCAFLWRAIAPRLADAGHTVIALDLLGHGESDRPLDMALGLAAQAEYVERALTSLRLPAVSLVGQDIGGLVALLLAASRPRRARRVMLLNPSDLDDLPGPEVRALQRSSAKVALAANALFGARPLLEPFLRASVLDPDRMSDLLVARYLAPFVGTDGVAQLLALASAVEAPDDDAWLGDVRAPVTIVQGTADRWTSAAAVGRLMGRLGGTVARTEALDGCGHLVAEETPERLLGLLQDWLAEPVGERDTGEFVADNTRRDGTPL